MDTLTEGVGSQASMDDPGMFRVSKESMDTLTEGVGSQASMDDPGMFRVSRESTDTLTGGGGGRKTGIHGQTRDVQSIQGIHGYSDGGVGSQASMDEPGMFRVSRESTDTLTGG